MTTAQKEVIEKPKKVKKEKTVQLRDEIREAKKGGELSEAMKNRLGHMADSFEDIGKEVIHHMAKSVEKTIKHQFSLIEDYLMKKIHELHGKKGAAEAKKHIGRWKAALLKDVQVHIIPEIRKTIKKNGDVDVEANVLEHISFEMIDLAKSLNSAGEKYSSRIVMSAVKELIKSSDEDIEEFKVNMMDRMSEEESEEEEDSEDENKENEYFDEEIEIDSSKIKQIKAFANKLASVQNGKYREQAKKIISKLKNFK